MTSIKLFDKVTRSWVEVVDASDPEGMYVTIKDSTGETMDVWAHELSETGE